jgi:uncharacterized DUF497 family protein
MEWDDGNESELRAHKISPEEVEDLFGNAPVWVPNKKYRAGKWKMVGYTSGRRRLTVVAAWDENRAVLRPITGWECTTGEARKYLGGR